MKFKPYPKYKDSGSEGLGEVPEGWEVMPLKRLGWFQAGAGFPDAEQGIYDAEIPFYKVGDMNLEGNEMCMTSFSNTVTFDTVKRLRAAVIPPEAIIFAKVGAALKLNKRRILSQPSCIDNNMIAFIRRSCDLKWAYYWMCGLDLGELANPGAVPSINEGQLAEIKLPVPTVPEQHSIATFLDRETSRIDELISNKERQIELLQEKRQTLISHAVTKGLKPNAKMKDSGIEWLGKVPEHWPICRAKVLFKEINRRSVSGDEELLTVSHITGVTRRSEKNVTMFMAESLENYKKCDKGDLVINTMWAWMGAMGMAKEPGIVSPSYNVYRFRVPNCDAQYFDHLFRTAQFISEVVCQSQGVWSSRLRLYPESFLEIRIPRPPADEQTQIVAYIESSTGSTDAIQKIIEQSIAKLREYRTALISAAVTGKIDVRGEEPE